MNLFKSEWLHEPAQALSPAGYDPQRYERRYGVQSEPRGRANDAPRLLQLRRERATLWALARRDRDRVA